MYSSVREDSSTGSTYKLPLEVEFLKRSNDEIDTPHYIGHRKRVKERFIVGSTNFSDYELLEVMLFSAIPRKDVKPLAKKLLDHFNITDLINLDKERLLSIKGTNENLYINFAPIRELINRILKQKIINENIIVSWGSLIDYLKVNMGNMRLDAAIVFQKVNNRRY